jgi:WD40 repeat protein
MATIKILLFAANPQGTAPLDLPREFREIEEEVRRGAFRDALELILVPGTRPVDLLRKLNENQPQVVHFSSHGEPDHLVLESGDDEADPFKISGAGTRSLDQRDMKSVQPDAADTESTGQGSPRLVSKSALVNVLCSCDEGNLKLVVLNACHTRSQAEALTEAVDCVISMKRAITDRAAIQFAASFYGALAFGRSVQKAFEQGVARLSAEGIGEVETPELLTRAGVDAFRVVLVGSKPSQPSTPAEAPFLVPFPRNEDFVGRDGDLRRLHASLSGSGVGPVGIRPAGLTGMGGIGKTQLAVEYVYRHKDDYPDGIFWIDAAGPLAEGFARLAIDPRLRWAESDRPRDEQIRAAFTALNGRPQALLVLDNLPEPATIAVPLLPDCTPEYLRCRLLFTTRRHDLGRFSGVEVTVLPEEPALRLLLRHPSRRAALDPAHADHEHARAIARMLGRLPLALELAGAYLGKYSSDVSLVSYREGLRSDGALATLDADAAELTEADLRRAHDPAVAATIREQWETLQDQSARLLLRVASLFPESAAVSIARLGLLAGLSEEARPGRRSPLRRAVQRLEDACLVERLEAEQIRLHPLIREFAGCQISPNQVDEFRCQCALQVVSALESFPTLEALDVRRGVDGLQEDLIAVLELCPLSALDLVARLQDLLRLIQREAHNLRDAHQEFRPMMFAQQVRNRAILIGVESLRFGAEQRSTALGQPHFRLLWKASRESPVLVRTLAGHEDWVTAVAVTPDGRHALSGSHDRTLRMWDLQTGRLLRSFVGHEGEVSEVLVSSDGRGALSASHDGTIRLWDLQTGQHRLILAGRGAPLHSLAVVPDGRFALSCSLSRTVMLWDLATGQRRFALRGHTDTVRTVVVIPGGRHALSGSQDRTLKLWDLASGQLIFTLSGHEAPVTAVAVTPDGCRALSASDDRTLKLWDLERGQLRLTLAGHDDAVRAVTVTPDGRQVLSGSHDRTLKLWDLESGQLLVTLAGHDNAVRAVSVTPDGRQALSGSGDHTLKLWDLATDHSHRSSEGHEAEVSAVAATPDGLRVLSASYDRTIRIWDLGTGQALGCFTGHDDKVNAMGLTPDGRHVLSGSDDRTLKLWDPESGQSLCSFIGHQDGVSAVAVTPDGHHAVSAAHDRTGRLWNLATGQSLCSYTGHERAVSAVAVTPDGRRVLSASRDGTLKLWNLASGQLLITFAGHEAPVYAMAMTPDGCHALSASADRTIRVWDLATGQPLRSLAAHRRAVTAVAVTQDGRRALSASLDRTVRLWDIREGVCRAMAPLESAPLAIAVAPDGRTVVVGDRVGNIHCFQIHGN